MKKISLILLLAIGLGVLYTVVLVDRDPPQLYVVKIHADWCGTCKILEPKIAAVQQKLYQAPVRFITLDVTDEARTEKSQALATELGINEIFFQGNKNIEKTGTVAIFNLEKQEVVGKLTKDDEVPQMVEKINRYLKEE